MDSANSMLGGPRHRCCPALPLPSGMSRGRSVSRVARCWSSSGMRLGCRPSGINERLPRRANSPRQVHLIPQPDEFTSVDQVAYVVQGALGQDDLIEVTTSSRVAQIPSDRPRIRSRPEQPGWKADRTVQRAVQLTQVARHCWAPLPSSLGHASMMPGTSTMKPVLKLQLHSLKRQVVGQLNLPERTAVVNAVHPAGVQINAGPVGCFESRTAVAPPSIATSTQAPLPLDLVLLRHAAPHRSSSGIDAPALSPPSVQPR